MKTYLIHFRGHGHLSETKELASTPAGIEAAAKSAAEYWCRSNRSPFCVYTVDRAYPQIGEDLVATVTVDVDAPYTVFVVDQHSGKEFGHDFRRKADAESFHNRCLDAGIKSRDIRLVIWLKNKPRKTVTK